MANEYKYPENTETELYIDGSYSKSFGEILDAMVRHFGSEIRLDQFDIETCHFANVEGCSCCRDSGTYTDYICITKRPESNTDTANMKIQVLVDLADLKPDHS